MKILLTGAKVIALRPYWTAEALERLVGSDGIEKSAFSSKAGLGKPLYDMEKVASAEQTEAFRKWQERRKVSLRIVSKCKANKEKLRKSAEL